MAFDAYWANEYDRLCSIIHTELIPAAIKEGTRRILFNREFTEKYFPQGLNCSQEYQGYTLLSQLKKELHGAGYKIRELQNATFFEMIF